jgi:hypothetical protein
MGRSFQSFGSRESAVGNVWASVSIFRFTVQARISRLPIRNVKPIVADSFREVLDAQIDRELQKFVQNARLMSR